MPYVMNEPAVVGEVIAGEAIVINLDSGNYYSMEGSASYIWEQVIAGADVATIAQALAQNEGAEPDLDKVVQAFVDRLLQEALIRFEQVAPVLTTPSSFSARYTPPKLNVFTDMQSLLLLDPIHQVDSAGWPHAPEQSS